MDWLERFFNVQNDWHWGPFEYLRPAKNQLIGRKRYTQIAGIMILSILVIAPLAVAVIWMLPSGTPGLTSGAAMLGYYEYAVRQKWQITLASALLTPLLWWPYAYFWNRRAARLQQELRTPEQTPSLEGVWPPPPRRD